MDLQASYCTTVKKVLVWSRIYTFLPGNIIPGGRTLIQTSLSIQVNCADENDMQGQEGGQYEGQNHLSMRASPCFSLPSKSSLPLSLKEDSRHDPDKIVSSASFF